MNHISLATSVGVAGILFANLSFASQTNLDRQLDGSKIETFPLVESGSAIKSSSDFLQVAAKHDERGAAPQTTARQKPSIKPCIKMHKELSHDWKTSTDDQSPWGKLDGP